MWQEQDVLAPISQLVYPICLWMCLAMISNESFSSCQYCLGFSDNLSHKDVDAVGKPACSLKSVWDQFFISPGRCEKCMVVLYTGLSEIAQKESVWWEAYLKHENITYFFRLFMRKVGFCFLSRCSSNLKSSNVSGHSLKMLAILSECEVVLLLAVTRDQVNMKFKCRS